MKTYIPVTIFSMKKMQNRAGDIVQWDRYLLCVCGKPHFNL